MDDAMIPVWVDRVDYQGGTVAFGYGRTDGGEPVEFCGEPRALHPIAEALETRHEPVLAVVAAGSIIRRPHGPVATA